LALDVRKPPNGPHPGSTDAKYDRPPATTMNRSSGVGTIGTMSSGSSQFDHD
jgi:hypothetical protein